MSIHIIEEAKRCLKCKKPKCVSGCPVETAIPEMISLLLDNNIEKAGKLLFDNNPLSLVCSHVCPQEDHCEAHCVLEKKGNPINISAIEQYISDYYLNTLKPEPSGKDRGKVAIVGSGPAGITIAFLLSQKNYDVTIFEGNEYVGGVLRYGIPDFRLPNSILDRLMEVMRATGVKIRPNTAIGTNLTLDDLFRDGFLAVFLGTGVWMPRKLGIKGESLGHVHFAIEYLRNPDVYDLGRRVAVVGAGNVAMDVARTALRHGSREVFIIYGKNEESMSAARAEVEYAKIDGAQFMFYKTPVEISDEGIILADSEMREENGRGAPRAVPGTEHLLPVDSVLVAIGQGPRAVIVSTAKGIELKPNGLVATDECGRTSRKGVFASGDVVTGAKTVVSAVNVSRKVANAIDEYISGLRGDNDGIHNCPSV